MFKDFLPPLSPTEPSPEATHHQAFYGHEMFHQNFLKSLQSETLHHAWLLTGPQGVGKASSAKFLARLLLRHPEGSYPETIPLSEPEDSVWHQTHQGTHPDFLFIEKGEDTLSQSKSFITIDAVRHLNHMLQQTSEGWKVIIVDSLDDMNEKAQNALLKNLEEPSPKTVFFLISHMGSNLSPTIRSRCQEVKLHPISTPDMEKFISTQELTLTEGEKDLLCLLSKGRLGTFQHLVQNNGLGLVSRIIEGIKEVFTRKSAPYPLCFKLSETVLKEGDAVQGLFYYLLTWYCHRITERIATQDFSKPLNSEERDLFKQLPSLSLEKWLTAEEKILELIRDEQQLKLEPKQTVFSCFIALEKAL